MQEFLGAFGNPRFAAIDPGDAMIRLGSAESITFDWFVKKTMMFLKTKVLKYIKHDFGNEAERLWKKLNLPDPRNHLDKANWNKPDVVWVHPVTGAKFFIGDIVAARNLELLEKEKIFHIINAQGNDADAEYPHKDDPRFTYL